MGIRNDLERGKSGENKVRALFEHGGCTVVDNKERGKLSDHDLLVSYEDKEWTVEVKNDEYAAKSGNAAIEVWNTRSDKPSGLLATKAVWWCHITDGMYFIQVDKLRKLVDSIPPKRIVENAGDGNAKILLYPTNEILSHFIKVDESNLDLATFFGV